MCISFPGDYQEQTAKQMQCNEPTNNKLFMNGTFYIFFKLGFNPCKAEQSLELQENIQEICFERTYI